MFDAIYMYARGTSRPRPPG